MLNIDITVYFELEVFWWKDKSALCANNTCIVLYSCQCIHAKISGWTLELSESMCQNTSVIIFRWTDDMRFIVIISAAISINTEASCNSDLISPKSETCPNINTCFPLQLFSDNTWSLFHPDVWKRHAPHVFLRLLTHLHLGECGF